MSEQKYPLSGDGVCIPLSIEENKILGENLNKLSLADLLSYRTYCIEKQNYFNRRIPKDSRAKDSKTYEIMYSWWLWWFHMTEYIDYTINLKTDELCKKK